ncbi:MAG: 30S ribosomal protein S1, partial [Pseudomonadota bacterium]
VETEFSEERESLLESLHDGSVVKGIVKNLTDYGAFLDLGGVDGLLHITDMAWKRVKHPSEVVAIGDEIEVKILKFDKEKTRVSLGLKQLGSDPWADLMRRFPEGARSFGKVTNIADYGCFVEIEDGVEGLVHVSEMDWTSKNVNPAKIVALGDEVEVMILDIDEERRRISLGIKQCQSNPWDEFAATHDKGSKVSGQIKSITDFGIFIGLDGGIDGLVHLSDISWNDTGEDAIRNFKKGEEIEAIVLTVDAERERISLGIKQLDQDPLSIYLAEHQKGSIVTGKVKEIDAKAAIIELGDGIEGVLRATEYARDKIEDLRSVLKEGESVEAKFMGVDRKTRAITLSIKAKEEQEEADALQDYNNTGGGSTSLGDIIKEQMGD